MQPLPTSFFDDEPLNLDQDDDLLTGRTANCQLDSLPDVSQLLRSLTWNPCSGGERELHQTDFEQWLA